MYDYFKLKLIISEKKDNSNNNKVNIGTPIFGGGKLIW